MVRVATPVHLDVARVVGELVLVLLLEDVGVAGLGLAAQRFVEDLAQAPMAIDGPGHDGGILAVALFAADLSFEVWRAHLESRTAEAEEAQQRLTPLASEIVGRMGVAGVKAAMDRVGLRGGRVRAPLLPLSPADDTQVAALLRMASVTAVA